MSLPWASGAMPVRRAAPRRRWSRPACASASQGLSVRPCSSLSVNQRNENAGVLLRATKTAPARAQLCDLRASRWRRHPRRPTTPFVVARARLVAVDLHGDRHAVQRPEAPRRRRRVGRVGGGEGVVGEDLHERVEHRVDLADARQAEARPPRATRCGCSGWPRRSRRRTTARVHRTTGTSFPGITGQPTTKQARQRLGCRPQALDALVETSRPLTMPRTRSA